MERGDRGALRVLVAAAKAKLKEYIYCRPLLIGERTKQLWSSRLACATAEQIAIASLTFLLLLFRGGITLNKNSRAVSPNLRGD